MEKSNLFSSADDLREFLETKRNGRLKSYADSTDDIEEHFGIEQSILAGGYGYRQILELVQNGADAILEEKEANPSFNRDNRIHVALSNEYLYVANTGAPLDRNGVLTLLRSHYSKKRGNQIGRFGIGFKSLLGLNGTIDIFSKSHGNIRFDPDRCRKEIRDHFGVMNAPALRLAWALDESERVKDLNLSRFDWAETIVRTRIGRNDFLDHLKKEIEEFPTGFLLFLSVPVEIILENGLGPPRTLVRKEVNGLVELQDGNSNSTWRLFKNPEVKIQDKHALDDATHIHARESVPIYWALPVESRKVESGRFWAFFPTKTPSYLPGILNAPWKLNNDRNAIIGGAWNKALMEEAAQLIANSIHSLAIPSDPGSVLDAFPRQMERTDEDAHPLVEAVWEHLMRINVIPDARGVYRNGSDLHNYPTESVDIFEKWLDMASESILTQFIHPSCLRQARASRVYTFSKRLMKANGTLPNLRNCTAISWFNILASKEPIRAKRMLELAELFKQKSTPESWDEIRPELVIIPSEQGDLLKPDKLLIAQPGCDLPGEKVAVHPELLKEQKTIHRMAEVLGIKELDHHAWKKWLEEALFKKDNRTFWGPSVTDDFYDFWRRLQTVPLDIARKFVSSYKDKIKVLRTDNCWVNPQRVLLPGEIVKRDDKLNQALLVDETFHQNHRKFLVELGVADFPHGKTQIRDNPEIQESMVLESWLSSCRKRYKQGHYNSARADYLFASEFFMPSSWHFLERVQGNANAGLTSFLLKEMAEIDFQRELDFGHTSIKEYPRIKVPHPLLMVLKIYGTIAIGSQNVSLLALQEKIHEPALMLWKDWKELKPLLSGWPSLFQKWEAKEDDIQKLWKALFEEIVTIDAVSGNSLQPLWEAAAKDGVVPRSLPRKEGFVVLEDVYCTGSLDLAKRAEEEGRLAVTLDEVSLKIWLRKGAKDLSEIIKPQWNTNEQVSVSLLVSALPELRPVLKENALKTARCQNVWDLVLLIDQNPVGINCYVNDDILLLDSFQIGKLSRAKRLETILKEINGTGWLKYSTGEALETLGDTYMEERRSRVKRGKDFAERLCLAIDERREPFLKALGNLQNLSFIKKCDLKKLASLVLAQYGPTTLSKMSDDLLEAGLKPPRRWNTPEAREFVERLGFPVEFAASPERKRNSEESFDGPFELPPLHDFQKEVLSGIRELIGDSKPQRRGVISLPTGGGKTRVTVQAAVELILKKSTDRRTVLWIAQTDELCEQAVQAFRQIWINLGAEKTELRVIRLWGGNRNPVAAEQGNPVVVVASIQTLKIRANNSELNWLKTPGLVVIDECHHAIAPSYTELLKFLNADFRRWPTSLNPEPPILGLSATPFRTNEEESRRLAKRFDNVWFPKNQEDLHLRLLREGVLSHSDFESLNSGVNYEPDELSELTKLLNNRQNLDLEQLINRINERLARIESRNERLMRCIKDAREESILFFSNSVEHSMEMAARLNLEGIPAAPISSDTPSNARRYFLEKFKAKKVRVLCNHSVLTTGFDAPKVDMILISRQVFSSVSYMQMVGRGLRGEKNGGTARCRIITVMDNLGRFENLHPYHLCKRNFGECPL